MANHRTQNISFMVLGVASLAAARLGRHAIFPRDEPKERFLSFSHHPRVAHVWINTFICLVSREGELRENGRVVVMSKSDKEM